MCCDLLHDVLIPRWRIVGQMRILYLVAAVVVAAHAPASSLPAQDALRVLRHTPGDTAKPSNLVTVTFDRPVASALDRTISAERLFRIEPAIAGSVAWRDPVTIRFVPAEPMTPGARFTVTIDTAVRGLDGSKLEQPYRFSFHIPGPRLLARSFDDRRYNDSTLAPDGRVTVVYSSRSISSYSDAMREWKSKAARRHRRRSRSAQQSSARSLRTTRTFCSVRAGSPEPTP